MKKIIILSIFVSALSMAFGQDGTLDLTFNAQGYNNTAGFYGDNVCSAVQNDGKIVVAGKNNQNKLVLLRYNTDGSLDLTFNAIGTAIFTCPMNGFVGTSELLIQNDGKYLVVGQVLNNSYDYDIALIRINANATIDNTFGTNGIVTANLSAGSELPGKAQLQSDGKILVSAHSLETNTGAYYFTVIRYNVDGSFDTSFNTTGYNKIDLVCSNFFDYNMFPSSGLAVQNDGKILFVGAYGNSESTRDMICLRLNSNGTLDNTLNTTGYITIDFNGDEDFANDVKVDNQGKIVIVGKRYYYSSYAAVARLNPDGTPDMSFGSNGKASYALGGSGYCKGFNIDLLPDDKLLIGGTAYLSSAYLIATTRINHNGSVDNTFGTNGSVAATFLGASNLQGYDQSIQSDGKIVVSCGFNQTDFSVIRYNQRAYPAISSYPTASGITYGSDLSASSLTGGNASVPGTWVFENPGFVPEAGNYLANVFFVPTDASTYASMPGTVSVLVSPKQLTVSGAAAENKPYDGSDAAVISGASLVGVVGADDVTLNNSTAGIFNQSAVGTDIPVSVNMSIAGNDINNYTLLQPNGLNADIIAKTLTVNGTIAENKIYDGTNQATINGASLSGVVGSEDVLLSNASIGTFNQVGIGTAIEVTANMSLTGADISNYSLTQPVGLSADITARELSIGGSFDVDDKQYDGNTSANIIQNNLVLQNVILNDDVILENVVSEFASADIGDNVTVNITQANLNGAENGNYTLTLMGAPTTLASITELDSLIVTVTVLSQASCGQNNAEAVLSVSGGLAPYEYLWSNGSTNISTDTLNSGTNSVIVTDALGHSAQTYFDISNSDGPIVAIENISHVSCFGAQNGFVEISVSGNAPTIEWSTGSTNTLLNQLSAATYQVTATDNLGCKTITTVEITEPSPIYVSVITDNSTCGAADGSAYSIITGGMPPYNEQWSDGFLNLSAGSYNVTVSDMNGCQKIETFNISNTGAPEITVDNIIPAHCGEQGSIYISLQNVIGTPTFNWNNTYNTEDLVSVPTGQYSLTVTDGSCISILETELPVIPPSPQEICVVTVDQITANNLIVWEKEVTTSLSHYNIYRETSVPGQYTRIDSVLYQNMSEYSDLVANPMVRSWRYKVSSVDNCGFESSLSQKHKTIHLTINAGLGGNYNLIWGDYEGFPYTTFYINRHLDAEGWVTLDSLPNDLHTYTDTPLDNEGLWYTVTVKAPHGCVPTSASRASGGPYYQSTSNLEDEGIIHTKISESIAQQIKVYPNPNNGQFIIELESLSEGTMLKGFDVSGRCIFEKNMESNLSNIDIESLPKGVYLFKLIGKEGVSDFRIVTQQEDN